MSLRNWGRSTLALLATAGLAFALGAAPASEAAGPKGDDEVIVHLKPGVDPADVARSVGGKVEDRIPGTEVVRISVKSSGDAAASTLAKHPGVNGAEKNVKVGLVTAQEAEFDFDSGEIIVGSNLSSVYRNQWAAERLGLADAHSKANGAGVTVAVLDTGVDDAHPELRGSISPIRKSFLAGDPSIADVGNGRDDNGNGRVDEAVGHGTFIAGLIELTAPGASIMPLRVLDSDGVGNAFDVAAAIRFAVDNGATVLNLSFGSERDVRVIREAIKYAHDKGATVVAATGNVPPGKNGRGLMFPARYDDVLAIVATERDDTVAPFARLGKEADLGAPGAQIISLYPGGQYAWASGTSMSAGLASGAAAVVRSQHSDWKTPQVERRLESTARPYNRLPNNQKNFVGAGIIDLGAAVR